MKSYRISNWQSSHAVLHDIVSNFKVQHGENVTDFDFLPPSPSFADLARLQMLLRQLGSYRARLGRVRLLSKKSDSQPAPPLTHKTVYTHTFPSMIRPLTITIIVYYVSCVVHHLPGTQRRMTELADPLDQARDGAL